MDWPRAGSRNDCDGERAAYDNGRRALIMPTILLVEDNELNRDMLQRRLEKRGYIVVVAEDGEACLIMAEAAQPDLILMDLGLPVMDGWEATRRLRANAATEGIPILALTAHAMAGDEHKALAAGCDEYESKPIAFERLLEKMERLLHPNQG